MEDIGLYFEYNNLVIQLPVNPEELEVSFDGNSSSFETIKLGEINILKKKKLGKMSIKSFFPESTGFSDIRTLGEFKSHEFYRDFFLNLMELGVPCRFIVTGIDINMLVSIDGFKFKHQGGDYEDEYYTLDLKQYREFGVQSYTYAAGASLTTSTREMTEVTLSTPGMVNGAIYTQSDAGVLSQTVSECAVFVVLIDPDGVAPYFLATADKAPLGWCKKESLVLK